MRDVHLVAAHRRRRHIQRTQGGAALYPGLSHYAPLGRTIRLLLWASTAWRQVATRDRWLRAPRSHSLPSGGLREGKPPPSGDRWLRAAGGYAFPVATRCHAVD
jgi:hypothetical protein